MMDDESGTIPACEMRWMEKIINLPTGSSNAICKMMKPNKAERCLSTGTFHSASSQQNSANGQQKPVQQKLSDKQLANFSKQQANCHQTVSKHPAKSQKCQQS
jgi:hypothetical protein